MGALSATLKVQVRRKFHASRALFTPLTYTVKPQEGALGENLKVHKSQLERDRDQALALQAARKKAGHNPLTPYPVKV